MTWFLQSIGNAAGEISVNNHTYEMKPGRSVAIDDISKSGQSVLMNSAAGKLADSQDSFLLCCLPIDPQTENFFLSATFTVRNKSMGDNQSGFGLIVLDSVVSLDERYVHRNYLAAGCFRLTRHTVKENGVRIVAGYETEAPLSAEGRIVDGSRCFEGGPAGAKDKLSITLAKTDEGFLAGNGDKSIFVPGCDFLRQQDKNNIYVGFFAARKICVEISEIKFEKSFGTASTAPAGTIKEQLAPYPFAYEELIRHSAKEGHRLKKAYQQETIYVSCDGGEDAEGTSKSPAALTAALESVLPGQAVILQDGIYRADRPFFVGRTVNGTREKPISLKAQNPGKAVLSGLGIKGRLPLFILYGSYWQVSGIGFTESPSSGLLVCGSHNEISFCAAYKNGDTGILLCSYPGDAKENRPSHNLVRNCDSFDNCDEAFGNADGFGAKLSTGEGNSFTDCIAYNNIDDGFDLYTRATIGSIGAVTIKKCVAYNNGFLSDESFTQEGQGTGFKLGGENVCVNHQVWDCIAYGNHAKGFSSNSNPAGSLHYCTAYKNGKNTLRDNFSFYTHGSKRGEWMLEGLLPDPTAGSRLSHENESKWFASTDTSVRPGRNEDGSINLHGLLRLNARAPIGKGARIEEDRKNILMLITTFGQGGAERVTVNLANAFSQKHNVYLANTGSNENRKLYSISPEVKTIGIYDGNKDENRSVLPDFLFHKWQSLKKLAKIKRIKKDLHIDVSISMLKGPNLYNALTCGGSRAICSERNDPKRKGARYLNFARISYGISDFTVFQSEEVKRIFSQQAQKKSKVIYNPVSVGCLAAEVKKDKLVNVGRLHPQKNQRLLLESFAIFRRNHPSYKLHIYGTGELEAAIENWIGELDLKENVILEGFVESIHEAIKDAKIFVLSSDYEGLCNSLMEAMMMGIPCISTNCTGSGELIEDGETGLLVPMGDTTALADAMVYLADDVLLQKKLAQNAREFSKRFAAERVIEHWNHLL